MNRLQYLLTKLAEEASEVSQIALKTQQFGLDEKHYKMESNNVVRCHEELDDIMGIVDILNVEFDFGYDVNSELSFMRRIKKQEKVTKYYQYSKECGMITEE